MSGMNTMAFSANLHRRNEHRGTGWKAEKRTSGQYDKVFPQLQVVGSKIYYVRQQPDASKNRQIWTMEMCMDGTGWKEVQRTDTPFDKQFLNFR